MTNQLKSLAINSGTSILIFARNSISKIDVLLSNFLDKNTLCPVELIIVTDKFDDELAGITSVYAKQIFIRIVKCDRNDSKAEATNFAASKARFSNLMVLNDEGINLIEKDSYVMKKKHENNNKLKNRLISNHETEAKLKEENEYLLLQLHQVQEELETYYIKYQELKSDGLLQNP